MNGINVRRLNRVFIPCLLVRVTTRINFRYLFFPLRLRQARSLDCGFEAYLTGWLQWEQVSPRPVPSFYLQVCASSFVTREVNGMLIRTIPLISFVLRLLPPDTGPRRFLGGRDVRGLLLRIPIVIGDFICIAKLICCINCLLLLVCLKCSVKRQKSKIKQ